MQHLKETLTKTQNQIGIDFITLIEDFGASPVEGNLIKGEHDYSFSFQNGSVLLKKSGLVSFSAVEDVVFCLRKEETQAFIARMVSYTGHSTPQKGSDQKGKKLNMQQLKDSLAKTQGQTGIDFITLIENFEASPVEGTLENFEYRFRFQNKSVLLKKPNMVSMSAIRGVVFHLGEGKTQAFITRMDSYTRNPKLSGYSDQNQHQTVRIVKGSILERLAPQKSKIGEFFCYKDSDKSKLGVSMYWTDENGISNEKVVHSYEVLEDIQMDETIAKDCIDNWSGFCDERVKGGERQLVFRILSMVNKLKYLGFVKMLTR